jgi:hypothetical protein
MLKPQGELAVNGFWGGVGCDCPPSQASAFSLPLLAAQKNEAAQAIPLFRSDRETSRLSPCLLVPCLPH